MPSLGTATNYSISYKRDPKLRSIIYEPLNPERPPDLKIIYNTFVKLGRGSNSEKELRLFKDISFRSVLETQT